MPEKFTPREALTYIPERYRRNPKLFDENLPVLNIGSRDEEPYLQKLSNFAPAEFELDGVTYASVEGFIQSLKFWEEEDQERISKETGYTAKKETRRRFPEYGNRTVKDLIREGFAAEGGAEPVGYVTNYQGIAIPYRSPEHYDLIARAIRAKFDQNEEYREALFQTGRHELTHDLGYPESPTTSLPAEIFATILMRLRQEYQTEESVDQSPEE